jgi:hypothetical protein
MTTIDTILTMIRELEYQAFSLERPTTDDAYNLGFRDAKRVVLRAVISSVTAEDRAAIATALEATGSPSDRDTARCIREHY